MNDTRRLRQAFGTFVTGVTVIATRTADGTPRGFTANSFTSVSLDPPLLLVCVAKAAASCEAFVCGGAFSVNILSEAQQDVSNLFASKRPDKFRIVDWKPGGTGSPILNNVCAWFDCRTTQIIDAGDHYVVIGHVAQYETVQDKPLGYAQGGYFRLDLERQAANALSASGRTVVGAILDCDGKIVLIGDPASDSYGLPEVGRSGLPGTASRLRAMMREHGIGISLDFVFAVFEDPRMPVQHVYYRGTAAMQDATELDCFDPSDVPWSKLTDPSTVTMLRRYIREKGLGAFGIYADEGGAGKIHTLAG